MDWAMFSAVIAVCTSTYYALILTAGVRVHRSRLRSMRRQLAATRNVVMASEDETSRRREVVPEDLRDAA